MTPGQEMDRLVAKKVMGFDFTPMTLPSGEVIEVLLGWAPAYSTRIDSSWWVVEKLRVDHYVEISTVPGGWWVLFQGPGEEEAFSASADTIAEAICRAALKAVGAEVPS
jgi:hypothetical protein